MVEALALVLLPALAVAINPVPVLASLAMAGVDRGVTLALVFAAGWMLGLAVESYIVLLAVNGFLGSAPAGTWDWVHATVAVLLLLLAWRLWRVRARTGRSSLVPAWLDEVAGFTVPRTLGVGFSLAAANPRVVVFSVAGMAALVQSDASASGWVWFVLLGSLGVLVPVATELVRRDSVPAQEQWWRSHNVPVAVTVLVLVAATQLAAAVLSRPA
jgi:threonine/homoserine/homoserine lactone efflux protein